MGMSHGVLKGGGSVRSQAKPGMRCEAASRILVRGGFRGVGREVGEWGSRP